MGKKNYYKKLFGAIEIPERIKSNCTGNCVKVRIISIDHRTIKYCIVVFKMHRIKMNGSNNARSALNEYILQSLGIISPVKKHSINI